MGCNWELLNKLKNNKIAIHCDSKIKRDDFFKIAKKHKIEDFIYYTWDINKEETCYFFNKDDVDGEISYNNINWYQEKGCEIWAFEQFEEEYNKVVMNDLKIKKQIEAIKDVLNQYDGYCEISGGWDKKTEYIVVKSNDKRGLINIYGEVLIEPQYDKIGVYMIEEYIRVELNGKWGFVDINNNIVIPIMYDSIDVVHNGVTMANLNGEEFFINMKNERVENVTGYYDEN